MTQLSTLIYKLRKEKQKEKDTLVDPSTVTVLTPVENEAVDQATSSQSVSSDLSLHQPSLSKELQEVDEKWSIGMARLEALLTLDHRPLPKPSFSPVKAPDDHKPPAGALPRDLLCCQLFLQAKPAQFHVWMECK